jgi:hypothetical protein
MKKTVGFLFASALCLPLCAQQPSSPPAVLRIFREDIKEGKGGDHEKSEAAFMQAAAKINYPSHVIGLTAITGTSEAVFLEEHASIASIADSQAALDNPEFAALDAADAQLRTGSRSFIAVYRPDLSYAVDKIQLPKVRYFSIETVRVREGHQQTYSELVKMLLDAARKSADNQPVAVYEVVSGALNSTFLVMQPSESLKSMDDELQHDPGFFKAMGEEGIKRYNSAVSDAVVSEESILFAVNPQMSLVPKEWIAADPDFWTPKPVKIPPVKTTKAPPKAPAKAREKATRAKTTAAK